MFIIPFPDIENFKKFHVSLLLALFLIAIHFTVEFSKYNLPKYNFSESESNAYLNVQTKLYQRHLARLKNFKNKNQRFMASVMDNNSDDNLLILSSLSRASILDSSFDPLTVPHDGIDILEYQEWLNVYTTMQKNLTLSPAYMLGINSANYGWDRWLSYMFVHIGFYHLFSNALFLLFFGALIETLFGGVMVALIFLGSGFFAAPVYMYLNDLSQISLVGASGGVCGLIAFYSIYQFKEKIRYFYWVLPFEGYYGFISLNAGLIIFLWMLGDLAGYFSGVDFLDSVAYAAHLGGFLIGTLCALGLHAYEKTFRTFKALNLAD